MSGKFELMSRMLTQLRASTTDRIVIVSCYTQTLDLFTVLCREKVRWLCGKSYHGAWECLSRAPVMEGLRKITGAVVSLQNFPVIRLDGSTSAGKRQKLVDQFNDPKNDEFVFLLSSKA